jgi:cytochrome d ubiquinol oxidase subunit I
MVILGGYFILLFAACIFLVLKNKIQGKRWLLHLALWSIPLAYLAQQCGWIVAELGRQPWVVQDLMPTVSAVSNIAKSNVVITFWLFAATFTLLLIAEVKIMLTQIKKESQTEGEN